MTTNDEVSGFISEQAHFHMDGLNEDLKFHTSNLLETHIQEHGVVWSALTCLDMTFYPEIYHDVDALTRDDDICWSTQYLLGCISENLNTFCDRYQSIMEQTFGHHIQVIIDKYSYNGSCYEDYGDYDDYTTDDFVTWESTTLAFNRAPVMITVQLLADVGAVLVVVLILLHCSFTEDPRERGPKRDPHISTVPQNGKPTTPTNHNNLKSKGFGPIPDHYYRLKRNSDSQESSFESDPSLRYKSVSHNRRRSSAYEEIDVDKMVPSINSPNKKKNHCIDESRISRKLPSAPNLQTDENGQSYAKLKTEEGEYITPGEIASTPKQKEKNPKEEYHMYFVLEKEDE
ncbi:unnamed protein product [Mytilus edulis]|uniref:Uncharacterized protein n=1 Tax=Mytilus edulis TaxID=6550 RepID=A0A8S3TXA4_MYTED|nr:unnamed protein product [Mytilus edulis]